MKTVANDFNEFDDTDTEDLVSDADIKAARKKNLRRRTIIIAAIGIAVIIVAIIVSGAMLGSDKHSSGGDVTKVSSKSTTKDTASVSMDIKENTESWKDFEDSIDKKYDVYSSEDIMVVKGIQGKLKGQQIKYVVTGYLKSSNIDIEVEMEYKYAEKLKVGNEFNVKYNYIELNSKRYVVSVYW